jgi:hypothetical protein
MKNFDFYIKDSHIGKIQTYTTKTIELKNKSTIDLRCASVINSNSQLIHYEFESAIIDYLNKTVTIGE